MARPRMDLSAFVGKLLDLTEHYRALLLLSKGQSVTHVSDQLSPLSQEGRLPPGGCELARANRVYSPGVTRILSLCLAVLLIPLLAGAADKMTKETFISGGQTRTYYLLSPVSAKKTAPAPLLVLLHGSGRDGRSLLEKWEPLAKKEGIILVGPDASTSAGWRVPDDGPEFVHDLIEMLADQLDVDRRRVYVFGHSAGAGHALVMALLESEYLAAVAVHAGAMHESAFQLIERAPRKTPIGMWVGTNDALFPLKVVRATRDALKEGGFSPELTEISGHTHWYYDRAADINKKVWAFLRTHALPAEPKYQRYPWAR